MKKLLLLIVPICMICLAFANKNTNEFSTINRLKIDNSLFNSEIMSITAVSTPTGKPVPIEPPPTTGTVNGIQF